MNRTPEANLSLSGAVYGPGKLPARILIELYLMKNSVKLWFNKVTSLLRNGAAFFILGSDPIFI